MELEDALLALAICMTFLVIAVPVLAVLGISLVDVLGRQDIGISKLMWLGVILAMPLLGLGLYWLFRPKDFDPLNEPRPYEPQLPRYRQAALRTAAAVPSAAPVAALTPALQGGADPEEPEDLSADNAA